MRSYAQVQKDFRDAFQSLAEECEGFVGHGQTFRVWFGLLVSRFGVENLDVTLAGFQIMTHMEPSLAKDTDLTVKFAKFLDVLKRIDNLEKELETLRERGIRLDLQVKATIKPPLNNNK